MSRNLVPWRTEIPNSLTGLRREMDSLFENFFGDETSKLAGRFAPRTNVAETESEYEVTVELPGMKAEDFTVELHNGQLVIRGEKKEESEQKDKTFHRVERYYGEFQRAINLAAPVDEDKVEANYNDGVLKLVIPKAEKARPRKISVNNGTGNGANI